MQSLCRELFRFLSTALFVSEPPPIACMLTLHCFNYAAWPDELFWCVPLRDFLIFFFIFFFLGVGSSDSLDFSHAFSCVNSHTDTHTAIQYFTGMTIPWLQ